MNFKQFEYILSIYETGNVSKAAKKLFISQSALSQQLLKLEEELGAPIFDRSVQPLKPTFLGEKYLEYVKKIFFDYEEANKLFENIEKNDTGRLIIGIPENRSIQLLPTLLPEFMSKYPNIEILLKEAKSYELDELILKGEIDFSVMVSSSNIPMIDFFPLIKEEIYLAVPKDNEINSLLNDDKKILSFEAFKDQPFILMKKGHRLRTLSKKLFSDYNFEPKIMLETSNVDLAHRIVASGTGVCFVTKLAISLIPLSYPPIYYPLGDNGIFWSLGICYHKDKHKTHAMELFFEHVRLTLEKLK
ncbi:MAG: LysR family transcriptional regulator [Lachnospiraceae bacterium]|nr:LysR family transcriptional regulator [Lachnospiraceae bacterium]